LEADNSSSRLILIGPEGDFSPREIRLALDHGFLPVSLGHTRLRTETAGLVAAAMMVNDRVMSGE
jgi:16S rRNA (uracil1498-N3)-methyltransferase